MDARAVSRIGAPSMPSWQVLRRRLVIGAVLVAVLAAGYLLWFRDSSFVGVDDIEVVGAESDAGVAAALIAAAEGMSTLNVDVGALEAAVADEPGVAAVSADANFPSSLRVTVELRRPAGYLEAGSGAVIAADGTVLETGLDRPEGLPVMNVEPEALGDRAEGETLAVAQALGGAPPELVPQIESARIDPEKGPTAILSGGLELRFGDSSRAEMKWAAASAILAEADFDGAEYLDLSVPSRPVAG